MSRIAHLRTFLEVYRQKSFSKAAERLGLSQPAVSQQIQALETLIGKKLFIRQSRGVAATDVADELAHSVAASIDTLEHKLTSFRFGQKVGGTVHIAAPPDLLHYGLAEKFSALLNDNFQLRLQTGTRTAIYRLLKEKQVDFAVTSSQPNAALYDYAEIFKEYMFLVFAPSLQQQIGKTANEEVLKQLPLISFDEELSHIAPLWQKQFGHAPDMQAAVTVPDMRIIKQLVLQGKGWTVLADNQCQADLDAGRLISLNGKQDTVSNNIYLVWNKDRRFSPSLDYAKQFILEGFGKA